MAGFENDVVVGTNLNFNNSGPKPHTGIITQNGQLLIGATTAPFIRGGLLTSLGNTVTITNGPGTINLEASTGALTSIFRAFLSSSASNVTGNGTDYFLIADTIQSQIGTSYNSSTGIYTAAVTGWYNFSGQISVTGITSGTGLLLSLVSSVNDYQGASMNPSAIVPGAGLSRLNIPFCVTIPMIQGETFQPAVTGYGQGANTMSVFGSAVTLQDTYVAGYFLGA